MLKHFPLLFVLLLYATCQHDTRLPVALASAAASASENASSLAAPMPMCHDPQAAFAAFADDPAFRAMHPTPRAGAAVYAGQMVKFPTADGQTGHAYSVQAPGAATNRCLFLFHEWWGLNDVTKNEADQWAKTLDMNVLALDLYDGKMATNADEAGKLMQANNADRSRAIILGASDYVGKKANIRTMGWCFGGGWALQAALALKKKAKGCVMYYGMPEKDVSKLKKLKTDVIFIHAEKDKWINDEVVGEFEKNMKAAKKSLRVFRYNADHAFANPSGPRYHEASANAAREVARIYLSNK